MTTKILVEELYESEVNDQQNDFNVDALDILKELGLEKQIALYDKSSGATEAFKYVPATTEQISVYLSNFPNVHKLEDFNLEVIPHRVLEILRDAKNTGKFANFGIMCDNATIKEDPVLFGAIKSGEHTYTYYLLARWGRSLAPYSELKKKAIEKYKADLEKQVRTFESGIVTVKEFIANKATLPKVSSYNGSPSLHNYLGSINTYGLE